MTYEELEQVYATTLSRMKSLYMEKGHRHQLVPAFQWERKLAEGWTFVGDVDAEEALRMYKSLGPDTNGVSPVLVWLRARAAWRDAHPEEYGKHITEQLKEQGRWTLVPELNGYVIRPRPSDDGVPT